MKGVYLNTKCDSIIDSGMIECASLRFQEFSIGESSVRYFSHQNKDCCAFLDAHVVLFHGWAFTDKLIDANEFYTLYKNNELCTINAGNFIAIISHGNNIDIINDPFGLSTHYYRFTENSIEIAPTTSAFDNKILDEQLARFENQQGHLVGNYTRFKDIKRLPPGSVVNHTGKVKVYTSLIAESPQPISHVRKEMGHLIESYPYKLRVAPLTGGFDSRLIASTSTFSYGYTYGAPTNIDALIGKQITSTTACYFQFELDAENKVDIEADKYIFDANVSNAFTIYRQISNALAEQSKEVSTCTVYDGYLGDGLQRASYLKLGGVLGGLFLLFPILYRLPLSAKYILKRRYRHLDAINTEFLINEFEKVTSQLNLTPYQNIIYFESLYGRGGRYIINGGNIAAGQFFTVVSPFAHKNVFNALLKQDFKDVVSYKNMSNLWSGASSAFTNLATESGIKPNTPYLLAPFLRVFNSIKQKIS